MNKTIINTDIRNRWTIPPDPAPADLEIRAIRGAQVILIRAALLGVLGPDRMDSLVETLSPSAARLLHAVPEADAWVPAGDVHDLILALEIIRSLMGSGVVARLTAERDAGRLPPFDPPGGEKLPGDSPRDLIMAWSAIFKARYKGGRAHLDALEAKEAWVSIWVRSHIWPGWASQEVPEWFKRVLEDHYKVRSAVTYMAPPEDRPWWHRYHLRWF